MRSGSRMCVCRARGLFDLHSTYDIGSCEVDVLLGYELGANARDEGLRVWL